MWMQTVAQGWLVLTVLTNNSGTALGVVTALQFIPQILLSTFGGVLADKVNRRAMIQICRGLLALAAAFQSVLVLSGVAQLWHIYVLAFVTGVVNALVSPVLQTFVSELVPLEQLPNAVGLNSTAFNMARLIGPALAGLLIAAVGTGWVFLINAGLFALPIIAVAMMRKSQLYQINRTQTKKGMTREGIKYVLGRSDIMVIIVVIFVTSALSLNFQITQAVMATQVFHKGAGEYGLLGSVMAVGALAGSLMAARRRYPRVRLVLGAAFALGIFEGLCALAPTYFTFALAQIPAGFAMLTLITAANAAIQISVPEELRGRIMGIYLLFFMGATPIGAPLIGWIAEAFGARWSLGVGAIAALVISVICTFWAGRHWTVNVHLQKSAPFITMEGPRERAPNPLIRTRKS